jgi:hypothetical protein
MPIRLEMLFLQVESSPMLYLLRAERKIAASNW